jgi:Zn-dependent protease/CBS domain-containing protein
MKWSWKIAQVAGIGIFMHWTFLLLIGWIVVMHIQEGHTIGVALEGVAFVLAIFGCVVLHELGHALTARRFGILTRDITLLPIGGLARLERMPDEPMQEFWVAIAGPAVNVVIAGVLFVAINLIAGLSLVSKPLVLVGGSFLVKLLWVNVILVLFNLLPAFPMDGGRILRALLASRLDYARATRIAAGIGQAMAIGFAVLAFFGNPLLLFIALFVYLGAEAEAQAAEQKVLFQGATVRDAMLTRFRTLTEDDTLGTAISELLAGSQQDFPVVRGDQIVGLLSRDQLFRSLSEGGRDARVGEVMRRDCTVVQESEPLEAAVRRMKESACPMLPVLQDSSVRGMISMENVGEWAMVQAALRQADTASHPKFRTA